MWRGVPKVPICLGVKPMSVRLNHEPSRGPRDGVQQFFKARPWLTVALALVVLGALAAAGVLILGGRASSAANNSTPQIVGSATTFESASSSTATTTLPTGASSNDV